LTSGAAFELGEQAITLLGPLGGSGEVALGLGYLREYLIDLPSFPEAEGFVDLAGFMGVAFGGSEVAKAEVDMCEMESRSGFIEIVVADL